MAYEEPKKQEQMLREEIKKHPDNPAHYIGLAKVIWDQGRTNEAIDLLASAREDFHGNQQILIQQQIEHIINIEGLWEEMLITIVTEAAAKKMEAEYCGHEGSEEPLEDKLWDYANDLLDENAEKKLWVQVQNCRFCLTKLVSIQKTLSEMSQTSFSYDQINELVGKSLSKKK